MLLEQVLHIMLNQDYPRSVIISTANIWTFALRCISENGKYGKKKLCKRLQSHRLNPLDNARFPVANQRLIRHLE